MNSSESPAEGVSVACAEDKTFRDVTNLWRTGEKATEETAAILMWHEENIKAAGESIVGQELNVKL